MKQIIFSTGNARKLGEAQAACSPFGIKIVQELYDIDEIQSHDPRKISLHKVESAYEIANQPVVINDAFWELPALNGFPGGYMKDVAEWFAPDDFIRLLQGKEDRRVCLTECIVYKDAHTTKQIVKQFWGKIAETPRGSGNSIEQVAVFNGATIGERKQKGEPAFAPEDYVWHDFAKWYARYDSTEQSL